jgi:hypothetical protein
MMQGMRTLCAALTLPMALVACSAASPASPERDALLVDPAPQVRDELHQVVSAALHGAPVRLADDALTTSPVFAVEHVQPRDAQGRPLNGRELGRPELFRLLRSGSQCVLLHEGSGQRFILATATCAAR